MYPCQDDCQSSNTHAYHSAPNVLVISTSPRGSLVINGVKVMENQSAAARVHGEVAGIGGTAQVTEVQELDHTAGQTVTE